MAHSVSWPLLENCVNLAMSWTLAVGLGFCMDADAADISKTNDDRTTHQCLECRAFGARISPQRESVLAMRKLVLYILVVIADPGSLKGQCQFGPVFARIYNVSK